MYKQKTLATEILAAEKKRTIFWFAAFILTLTLAAFNRIKGRRRQG
jgi:hypothetical protein